MTDHDAESHYLHGTHPDEQVRLSRLNALLNDACVREMSLAGGEKVLDVGSGLGQLTRAIARGVGAAGRVVGVERSAEQIAEAARQAARDGEDGLVEFRAGDAMALPLRDDEWGTFDIAHTRFLLEHVPDPAAVVRGMVRAVRPGGRVILEDDCHDVLRLCPEPPGARALWRAYLRLYDRLGNDPLIGHRLVTLLWEAGATPARNTWLFFGGCQGDGRFDAFVANLIHILDGVKEPVVAQGLLGRDLFEEGIESLRRWGRRPDAAMWFAIAWAEGRKH